MYIMDYDSVKLTNYVQRFCIIPRVRGDVAEKVINYVGKQFRRYTTSDIYGIAS